MTISGTTGHSVADHVPVDGARLYCEHSGTANSGPPILLVHGNRDNHAHFAELASILARQRHVVAMDLRGHGLSTTLDRPMSLDLLAGDIIAVAAHYGWSEMILAGHSLGSVGAMTVASRHPELVGALVLMGAAATFELKFRRPDIELSDATFPDFVREANRRAAPLFFHARHPEVANRVIAGWSTTSLQVHRNLVAFRHPDLRPLVPGLRPPTLIVAGADDRCTTPGQAEWIHQNLAGSRLYVVPGTAHFMYMEEPGLVASAIADFLGGTV